MRALIVDDSRFVRDYLRGLLEEMGIECEEAADGQAGLTQLHGAIPSIWRWWIGTCRSWTAWTCSRICVPKATPSQGHDGHHRGRETTSSPLARCRRRRISDEALRRRSAHRKAGHARISWRPEQCPANRRTARILIVDDSAVMRSLLRSVVDRPRLEVAGTAAMEPRAASHGVPAIPISFCSMWRCR
jgi:CheY-like chemotaxis protein